MHIHILYSSWWGNTKFVIDTVADIFTTCDHQVTMFSAITADVAEFLQGDITILACPTYDHGLLHTPMDIYLQKSRESAVDLTGRRIVLIGLGDPKYDSDYTLESVRLMSEFILQQWGTLIYEPLRIVANPLTQVEKMQEWARGLMEVI
jgi:flavodoxin